MALQNRQSARPASMTEVASLLRGAGLDAYVQVFEDLGYDDIDVLEAMDDRTIASCIKSQKDQARFKAKLAASRSRSAQRSGASSKADGGGSCISGTVVIWVLAAISFGIAVVKQVRLPRRGDVSVLASLNQTELMDGRSLPLDSQDLDALVERRVRDSFSFNRWTLDEAKYYHLHIPRTGSSSWKEDVARVIPTTASYLKEFRCFQSAQLPESLSMTILRRPMETALSVWFECAQDMDHEKYVPQDFNQFVAAWHALRYDGVKNAFCCANPIDGIAYRMTCPSRVIFSGSQRRSVHEVDADLAIENMKRMFFIGLLEAYDESFCLFEARVRGRLPSHCNCEDKEKWASRPELHHRQWAKKNFKKEWTLSMFTETTLRKLAELTSGDARLYNAAIDRFQTEVRMVERRYGQRFLCRTLEYVEVIPQRPPDPEDIAKSKGDVKEYLHKVEKMLKEDEDAVKCRQVYGIMSSNK